MENFTTFITILRSNKIGHSLINFIIPSETNQVLVSYILIAEDTIFFQECLQVEGGLAHSEIAPIGEVEDAEDLVFWL